MNVIYFTTVDLIDDEDIKVIFIDNKAVKIQVDVKLDEVV